MTELVRHGPKPKAKQSFSVPRPIAYKMPTRRLSDFPHLRNLKPSLTWLKIHHPNKGYKLMWEFMGRMVYCGENQLTYKSRGRVIEAGEQLGKLLGVRFKE